MVANDVKIGEKFIYKNQEYLRIDMNPSTMFLTARYDGIVCALDLSTYKVMCFMSREIIDSINE